ECAVIAIHGREALAIRINDAGQIVGQAGTHGFLREPDGSVTLIDVPGVGIFTTQVSGINNAGQIVGNFVNAAGWHGFLATPKSVSLVDPVPDLLNGQAVTNDPAALATGGRAVQGVPADGVLRAVWRIPAPSVRDQISLT